MNTEVKELSINGVTYVPKGEQIPEVKGDYVIIRTHSAGVFAGYLQSKEGQEVKLARARRIYYWEGAATLSQLAMEGTSKPSSCKFPCEVAEIILTQAIEIIPCTEMGRKSIQEVKVWKA